CRPRRSPEGPHRRKTRLLQTANPHPVPQTGGCVRPTPLPTLPLGEGRQNSSAAKNFSGRGGSASSSRHATDCIRIFFGTPPQTACSRLTLPQGRVEGYLQRKGRPL